MYAARIIACSENIFRQENLLDIADIDAHSGNQHRAIIYARIREVMRARRNRAVRITVDDALDVRVLDSRCNLFFHIVFNVLKFPDIFPRR